MSNRELHNSQPLVARTIRRFSVPIILAWLAIVGFLIMCVPTLEQVEHEHSVSLNPTDAPSIIASKRLDEDFKPSGQSGQSGSSGQPRQSGQSESGSLAMIILEGQQPLGDDAHKYYDDLIRQLRDDPEHVGPFQDYWGDELTRHAAQSADGKAAYVAVLVPGKSRRTNESVEAVQHIVERTPAPPGVKVYVTGPAAINADMSHSGDRTIATVTLVSLAVIFITLLLVYHSIITVVLLLLVVGIELQVARGMVAFLGHHELIGLTTLAVNLLVSLVIAAGTDYGIFFIGRYQEARQAGEDRETAYYKTFHGVTKVVVASGLTIAGALFCLSFTRMPYFQVLGVPCAVGISVAVAVAITLIPAILTVGSRFRLFEPKRKLKYRGWRRIGTAIVRWPAPILVATLAVTLVGLLTLPVYKPSYNDQKFIPKDIPANLGYEAAARHFPPSAMMAPEVLFLETDHDLRNPADFLVLEKLAKAVLAVPGISTVQAVTRPEGTPIAHTTIPYFLSMQVASQQQFVVFQKERMKDLLKQADMLTESINVTRRIYDLTKQITATTHDITGNTHEVQDLTNELRDRISDFDDLFRPLRNYFYWEKHCADIPICWSLRNIFDSLDSVDALADNLKLLVADLDQVDVLLPQVLAQFPETLAILEASRTMLLTMHSTMEGSLQSMGDNSSNAAAMGKAFDTAQNDDSFYLPPEAFKNKNFQRISNLFLSPDGKTVRMHILQKGDPASPEGISRVGAIKSAAEEALKGTPLEDGKVYLSGTAATVKDVVQGSTYDLMIAGVAALCLIFIVMLIMTRSFVAALVIVGTVLLSLGASFGLSVFAWQELLGIQIHWSVLVMSVIVLLAVGSDYNLLLVVRMKEEIGAGINTGIIRAMGGTGKVVTNAGLVFAFTMGSMLVSDLRTIGQVGTTIGLGLLFDTLVVRAFMTPSVAALLGRWFWWPQQVRPRPASALLRPTGPRPLVRALLLR